MNISRYTHDRGGSRGATALCLVAMLVMLHAVRATATCPGPDEPWGGDDSGKLTCDAAVSKCQQKAAKSVAKMVGSILKCHARQAKSAMDGTPFDEEACEGAAVQKATAIDRTACACEVSQTDVATYWEGRLDYENARLYCSGWDGSQCVGTTPVDPSGDDRGCVDADPAHLKCSDGAGKCWAKLVKDLIKCHVRTAASFVKNLPFDEEACEVGPIPGKPGKAAVERFTVCMNKAAASGTCDLCVFGAQQSPTDVLTMFFVDDITNGGIFCGGGATTTTTSTTMPSGPVCCVPSPPDHCESRVNAIDCTSDGGTAFSNGEVCTESGCVPPPGTPGDCCEFGGGACVSGPPFTFQTESYCMSVDGRFTSNGACDPSGSCGAPTIPTCSAIGSSCHGTGRCDYHRDPDPPSQVCVVSSGCLSSSCTDDSGCPGGRICIEDPSFPGIPGCCSPVP
jgi:hypothetical protein